jgi:hypothetical protein
MEYSWQEFFQFRVRPSCIDPVLHQKLNHRLCRRPQGMKAGYRHSRHTAHSTAYKRKRHHPSDQLIRRLSIVRQSVSSVVR